MTQTALTWFLRQWRDGVVTGTRVQAVWTWPCLPHLPSMCSPDIPLKREALFPSYMQKRWLCLEQATNLHEKCLFHQLISILPAFTLAKSSSFSTQNPHWTTATGIILVHLWKGHKPSYTEYRYFKGKGNLDFSTMGILTCTACQYNEYIQEKWLKFSRLKLGSVLSTKHARVFYGCDLASIFALPTLSWIKLQAQCNLNIYTQDINSFLGMLWN